ncbi:MULTISPECIES: hypothetical protein [Streptomyces]|uniref:hypothetical protein n=1 Tax=Streptomyces TaxID=1883 RepID=UPI00103F56C2|nr:MULTISPECIES: hypothetical protein [Streptomyces]MBT3077787.1 hypothetical protein [Streptomyces sp. COG21]MBT3084630.1 hypothetical protein [Streptomyces sp. COG20]MBT3088761.1 hypothetical protein [Streptomyces sp. CYG21]MBT3095497.1 hypothetical protein [Streptomyces sp. CBG30]MBT3103422.1 hypothetical protein [Streptomyces sp. COG19]
MIDYRKATVPVWTLATGDVQVPAVAGDGPMTAERLGELRGVLAALADRPIATLEAHPLPDRLDRGRGIALEAASPLAQHLSELVTRTARSSSTAAKATAGGEVLYRMVVPAKFAAQFDRGFICSMGSRAIAGGVHGPLVDAATGKIVSGVTFMPVGGAAAGGAVGGAGVAAAGGAALTVAAPFVLMAVAVGVSAHADRRRQQAIEHITELLEQLREEKLDDEHSALDGCRDAIDKATAILLDQGKLGISLGLDSAVYAINTALGAADRRLARWRSALDRLPAGEAVEIGTLTKSFPGIDEEGGRFRAHLELAALAAALKRRVNVLQAVEHAQNDPENLFESFTRALRRDQQRLDELESGITDVLVRLSALELARPGGLRPPVFTPGEVDRLMRAMYRIRRLGDDVAGGSRATDVVIEMARERDGSLVVFPAVPA